MKWNCCWLPEHLLLLLWVSATTSLNCTIPEHEVLGLRSLYESTNGDTWTWRSGSGTVWNFTKYEQGNHSYPNPCTENWQGIECSFDRQQPENFDLYDDGCFYLGEPCPIIAFNSTGCSIFAVVLNEHNLTGSLTTDFFANMTQLITLSLAYNQLAGPLGNDISFLTNLTYLDLYNNSVSGNIPSGLGDLTNLTLLNLASNRFTGSLPSSLGNMMKLQQLFIYDNNQMSGSIPTTLGNLQLLEIVNLSNNSLVGEVPQFFMSLPSMVSLKFDTNMLTGSLPLSLCNLAKLSFFFPFSNEIRGSIPTCIGNMPALEYLVISNNFLTGSLPPSLGLLTRLKALSAENNRLTGTLPRDLSDLRSLQTLLLHSNGFVGAVESIFSPAAQANLSVVDLSNNLLSGTVPQRVFSLPSISTVSLVNNNFAGTLPPSICNASDSLRYLSLDGLSNQQQKLIAPLLPFTDTHVSLQGPIPDCIFRFKRIVNLTLSGNRLTGSLPNLNSSQLSPTLQVLVLSNNIISGSIPMAFKQHPFTYLDLSSNRIRGTCSDMTNFFSPQGGVNPQLFLHQNRLSGTLPSTFRDAQNIDILRGNLFGCTATGSPSFPLNDPGYSSTQCGTELVDDAFYFGAGCLVVFLLPAYLAYVFALFGLASVWRIIISSVKSLAALVVKCHATLQKCPFREAKSFVWNTMNEFRDLSLRLCVINILLFMPVCLGLKLGTYAATHDFEYGFDPSIAYMGGFISMIVLGPLLFFTMALRFYAVRVVSAERMKEHRPMQSAAPFYSTMAASASSVVLIVSLYILFPLMNLIIMFLVNFGYLAYEAAHSSNVYVIGLLSVIVAGFKIFWSTVGVPFFIKFMRKWFAKELRSDQSYDVSSFILQTGIVVANNFLAPIIANMIFNPGCFYYYFFPPSSLSIYVQYPLCVFVGLDGTCADVVELESQITFEPPFVYGYQCSSALLRVYAPIYIAMYIYVTFFGPGFRLFLAHACRQTYRWSATEAVGGSSKWTWREVVANMLGLAPLIFFPPEKALARKDEQSQGFDGVKRGNFSLFNTANVAAQMVSHLVMLTTYGVSFPPLGVMITLGIWSDALSWQAVLGWYFRDLDADTSTVEVTRDSVQFDTVKRVAGSGMDEEAHHFRIERTKYLLAVLEGNCVGLWRVFEVCGWYLLVAMALFHSFFLYDMLDGENAQAKPVIYVLLSLPLILWLLVAIFPTLSTMVYQWVKPTRQGKVVDNAIKEVVRSVSAKEDEGKTLQMNGNVAQTFEMGFRHRDSESDYSASFATTTTTDDHRLRVMMFADKLSQVGRDTEWNGEWESPLCRFAGKDKSDAL